MKERSIKRTILLFVTFLFCINSVKCSTNQYFNGQVEVKCEHDHMSLRIAESYAREVETEGDPVRVDLKKGRRSDRTCSATKGSDGSFLLEVPMTPDQHDCAANYQKLEDGASYEFEAGFKIKLPKSRKTRKEAPKTFKFSCMQEKGAQETKEKTVEKKTEVNVIKAGKHDLKLYIFTDADYTTEYVGSKLGEVPLNSEKIYVQYKTSADQDLKVENCRLSSEEELKKEEFIFVNMHCPLPQFEGTTFPAIQEGGTTTFSFNPGNFPFSKNSQTGYLECEIARVERNSATQSAENANCRRKRMAYLRKKRSLEEKVFRFNFDGIPL